MGREGESREQKVEGATGEAKSREQRVNTEVEQAPAQVQATRESACTLRIRATAVLIKPFTRVSIPHLTPAR